MGTSKASKKSRATKGRVRSNKPKATSNQASHTKQSARSSAASSAKSPKRQVKTKRAPRKSNKPKATSNQASHTKRNAQSNAASSAKSPKRQVKTKRPTMGTSKASKKSRATKGSNKPKATSNQASHRKRRARSSAASSAKSPKRQVETEVEFSGHATSQLMNLGLTGTQREEVEEWHKEVVRRELIQQGAHHALIMYLAHSEGSKDPKPHITASLRNEDGSTIKNAHGKFVHVYYDVERLPPIYADARR